jgi:hypothetical protein
MLQGAQAEPLVQPVRHRIGGQPRVPELDAKPRERPLRNYRLVRSPFKPKMWDDVALAVG